MTERAKMVRPRGVGRDAAEPRCLILYFDHVPTDDELRAWHEAAAPPPAEPAPKCAKCDTVHSCMNAGYCLKLDDAPATTAPSVIEAAWALVRAQGRMCDRWAEGDENVKRQLWQDLHKKGDALRLLLDAKVPATPAPSAELCAEVWVVFDKDGIDVAYPYREAAMEQAAYMAGDFPELGPWRVVQYIPAAALDAMGRERDDYAIGKREAYARIAKAEARARELWQDAARLDWLEQHDCWIGIQGEYDVYPQYTAGNGYQQSLRQLADQHIAARKEWSDEQP